MTVQEVFERQGYLVIAYGTAKAFDLDRASGIVHAHTVRSSIPKDSVMRVIGEADKNDWFRQCADTEDLERIMDGEPYAGYLKVVSE